MKGAKHFGVSDSNPVFNDSAFQSKRMMVRSRFDHHRAEPSGQHSTETQPLDMARAESSRQHVKALNTQFASWVQTQLQNHPDELWEDGAQDYLTHATNIMEKYSDVVNWLKANAAKDEILSTRSHIAPNKLISESKDNEIKSFTDNTVIAPAGTTAGFSTSWGSGAVFNNPTPFSFGSQSLITSNRDTSNDVNGVITEDDTEQPSSPSVKRIEEKGVLVIHEVKCKLYVKSSDPSDKDAWKDKGTGQLSIRCKEGVNKGTRDSKPTILVRNDVGKVLLNALLYPGIKTNMQKNSVVAIFHTSGDGGNDGGNDDVVVARTYLIRTKSEEDRNKLAAVIQEYAPAA